MYASLIHCQNLINNMSSVKEYQHVLQKSLICVFWQYGVESASGPYRHFYAPLHCGLNPKILSDLGLICSCYGLNTFLAPNLVFINIDHHLVDVAIYWCGTLGPLGTRRWCHVTSLASLALPGHCSGLLLSFLPLSFLLFSFRPHLYSTIHVAHFGPLMGQGGPAPLTF